MKEECVVCSCVLSTRLAVPTETTQKLLELTIIVDIVIGIGTRLRLRLGLGLLLRLGISRGVGLVRGPKDSRRHVSGLGGVGGIPLGRGGKNVLFGDGQGGGDGSASHS